MPVSIRAAELTSQEQQRLREAVINRLGGSSRDWTVFVSTDPLNNAWDVSVLGPNRFRWERRFSGFDRDAEVIAEAIYDTLPKAA